MECTRPNRSDAHLSEEEAAKVAAAAKDYFDGIAPKRHTKPQRSEYSSTYVDALSSSAGEDAATVPEYVRFQDLEKDTQKIVYSGNNVTEEFVETEYYADLNCIDKQHHTTGTGFINLDSPNGKGGFRLAPDSDTEIHGPCRGNPATNDWIPAPNDVVDFNTGKPSRSG